ncbi:Ltp family lipoprotein [uncultured Streptococcus sp.]|uniref:Ltp family lipoprotein n=1 Tax=uncultured Streptococcus sp. TaxID=83427 RepID=UPI0026DB9494|nr:Ltp family lipoprotein [uncultured Streptococcus sp.]
MDHAKLDYKKAALEKAKSYKKTLDLSSDEIYEQLTSAHRAKFTTEEAQYTIDHLND